MDAAEHDPSIDDRDIRADIDIFMYAGADTTKAALEFALHAIASNPLVQDKLQLELDEVLGDKSAIDMEDLGKLKYLEKCIKETLRRYPVASKFGRTLSEDVVLQVE